MLLLTTLTVGGSDHISLFEFLNEDTAPRLKEKANALLEIPAQKRVPFMVKQMKEALEVKGRRGIEKVDPSWLLQAMRGESPRVVGALLVGMPSSVVKSILRRLPPGIRKNLPPKSELNNASPHIIHAVRQMYAARFHSMPRIVGPTFAFRDVIHLERKDLFVLMRDLGLVELGYAFAAVGKLALAELCRRLPRSKAEELIMAVRRAAKNRRQDLKVAQRFLSRVVVNFDDTEEFFQKAGLWRIGKACLLEDEDFRLAFAQRMPREAGQLFVSYMEKASDMQELSKESIESLQDTIVLRIKALSKDGKIDMRWGGLDLQLNDPSLTEGDGTPQQEEPENTAQATTEPIDSKPSEVPTEKVPSEGSS